MWHSMSMISRANGLRPPSLPNAPCINASNAGSILAKDCSMVLFREQLPQLRLEPVLLRLQLLNLDFDILAPCRQPVSIVQLLPQRERRLALDLFNSLQQCRDLFSQHGLIAPQ